MFKSKENGTSVSGTNVSPTSSDSNLSFSPLLSPMGFSPINSPTNINIIQTTNTSANNTNSTVGASTPTRQRTRITPANSKPNVTLPPSSLGNSQKDITSSLPEEKESIDFSLQNQISVQKTGIGVQTGESLYNNNNHYSTPTPHSFISQKENASAGKSKWKTFSSDQFINDHELYEDLYEPYENTVDPDQIKKVKLLLLLATTSTLVTHEGSYYNRKLLNTYHYDVGHDSGATRKNQARVLFNTVMNFYRSYMCNKEYVNLAIWASEIKTMLENIHNEDGFIFSSGTNSRFGYALYKAAQDAGLEDPKQPWLDATSLPANVTDEQYNHFLKVASKIKGYSTEADKKSDNPAFLLAIWENELQEMLLRQLFDLVMNPKYALPDSDYSYKTLKKTILKFLNPVYPDNKDQKVPVEERVAIRQEMADRGGKEDFFTLLLENIAMIKESVSPRNKGMKALIADIEKVTEASTPLLAQRPLFY